MQNNQAIPFNKENFKQIFSVKFLLVIAISVPSAIVADYFKLPLAWFLGPMLATSVGALMGLKITIPRICLHIVWLFCEFRTPKRFGKGPRGWQESFVPCSEVGFVF